MLAIIFLIILGLFCAVSILRFNKIEFSKNPLKMAEAVVIGFIANFLDTLGIGSFVTATSMFNLTKFLKHQRHLPGMLNVMNGIPTIVQALFFVQAVKVEKITFLSLVISAMLGSVLGSKVIVKLDERKIRLIMSIAMFLTSLLMISKKVGLIDFLGSGNTAIGLSGIRLVIGIVGNFIFGSLMSAGVGIYAPCMVMIYLLGMKPIIAFPIMMTSSSAVIPVNTAVFAKEKMFQNQDIWLLIIGGVLGVLIAAIFVQGLSMDFLTWIIIGISFYTSLTLFRSAQTLKE
jgi:uncharacterized membrane protein YfcA